MTDARQAAGRGTLFLVVGPSGAGKDTLLNGARAALADDPRFVFARRVITRPEGTGAEDHDPVDEAAFERRRAAGGFLLSWRAHGLAYGLPAALAETLAEGRHVVANVSRAVIADASARLAPVRVIEITAAPSVRAQRLAGRGRETAAEIEARLSRAPPCIPDRVDRVTIRTEATREEGIARLVAALEAG